MTGVLDDLGKENRKRGGDGNVIGIVIGRK
jgi:hypothetical protein